MSPIGLGDIATPPATNTPGSFCTTSASGTFTVYLKDGSGVTMQSVDAGVARNIPVTKTTTYAMSASDSLILGDATSAGFTVTLPSSPTNGVVYSVKKKDATVNVVTVAGASGTIDGAANVALDTQYQSLDFMFDGTNWFIV